MGDTSGAATAGPIQVSPISRPESSMSSLERVRAALEHREPDRVPFDLGGSVLTGINRVAYQRLRDYLGLPRKDVEICDLVQQLARVDEDVALRLRVDVRCLDPGTPGPPRFAREGDYTLTTDEFGIVWRMPVEGGFYYDMYRHPLADAGDAADLDRFSLPDPLDDARFRGTAERARRFMREEGKAYILGRNCAGIFEVALWLRGFQNLFTDLCLNPGYAERLLDMITEMKVAYWRKALETVGEDVLVISEADDLATQTGLLISPEMYRRFLKPRHTRLFSAIREAARAKVYVFYHCCGAVRTMLPDLMEAGIDILNPVQVSARGMDTKELKRDFGAHLTFWGGGVDTQRVLPRGTPQEVRDETRRRIDDLAEGGGFVFSTVHNVQGDVPPENLIAMWEALQEHGVY